jgi:phospholipid/cholesterol/gamma-HCH transport system substrate-binding protein
MQRRERVGWRVGLLVVAALGILALFIIVIGGQNNLFRRMNHYVVRFENVKGLQDASPVQLNGVAVGRVESIVLSEKADERLLKVELAVDHRYGAHIRGNSQARIKTLGLLGDKFIEISAGSAEFPELTDGAEIRAVELGNVDQLITSGEDVVDNVSRISIALALILERVERGEGLLGQLLGPVADEDKDLSITSSLREAADSIHRITAALDAGRTPVARLLLDERMGAQLASSVQRLDTLMTSATEGDGVLPKLMHDKAMTERVERALANLETASARLAETTAALESTEGLLPKLINDKEFADEVSSELLTLVKRLGNVAKALDEGDGTAAKLIHDPQVYEALNDIIVGVNESKMLRWLIRNRQKAGIEKRYDEAQPGGAPPEEQDDRRRKPATPDQGAPAGAGGGAGEAAGPGIHE